MEKYLFYRWQLRDYPYGNRSHKKREDAEWSAEVIDDDIKDSIHEFLIS